VAGGVQGKEKIVADVGEQERLWNGTAGRSWVEAQAVTDVMYRPFEVLLTDAAAEISGGRVLDIGCGAGSTTLAVARRLGVGADCTGIDISAPLIAAAKTLAEQEGVAATFIRADAQDYGFAPASFDFLMSRFGVMFFNDPLRAFANLHHATRKDGRLRFFAWRAPSENPFMTAAERAAAPLLPPLPPRPPGLPGPFAFADRDRIHAILEESGWSGIEIAPADVGCVFPEAELVGYLTWMGPVGRILQEVGEAKRGQVVEVIRAAFEPFVQGGEVRCNAACWSVAARA